MNSDERPVKQYVFTRYDDPAAAHETYDSRYPEVAGLLIEMIGQDLPGAQVEHVGSTAIPGCGGKGVVDLMVVYPPGTLEQAKDVVEALGYQAFFAADPFPPERPVYVGLIDYDGEAFRTHAHLIPEGSPEVETQRHFRDRLRANPELVAEYVALKRAVLSDGVNDSAQYNDGKDAFIKDVIAGRRAAG